MTEELKPCPFCGATEFEVDADQVEHNSYSARIDCDSCETSFSTGYTERSEALAIDKVRAAWNRRAALSDAAQAPIEVSPEFTDSARAALVWVLYHHQGGSSPVGQPIRFALGMGAHEPLHPTQIGEALKLFGVDQSGRQFVDYREYAALQRELEASRASAPQAVALTEAEITEVVKQWFPDRAYQAPFFARALLAAHPATQEGN